MSVNTKVRDNFELYDKILIKIVDSTKVEPISFQDLYNSLFSIQALNPGMQNFKFEDLIIEDKNQPHENGMLFILQYFRTLGLINCDTNFNSIYATPLGIIKSHESFVQEYEDKINKQNLENNLLLNQVETNNEIRYLNRKMVTFNKRLFWVTFFVFLFQVLSFLIS